MARDDRGSGRDPSLRHSSLADREPSSGSGARSRPISVSRRDAGGAGRAAERAVDLRRRFGFGGWKSILIRVKEQFASDNLSITAAGMAFYLMLSIVPALLAVVSVYGAVADPAGVERQLEQVSNLVPTEGFDVVRSQLHDLVSSSTAGLSLGAALSALLALWSSAKGAKAMINGINIAFDDSEKRSSWKVQTLALAFTFGFIVFGIVSLALIAFFPWLVAQLHLGWAGRVLASAARWVLLFVAVVTALSVAYRFAPTHHRPCWRCVRWGAGAAAVLWLLASMGFSWYASSFGSFNETYGSLAGIVVLLLWLDITALIVLLGAEIASEIEEELGLVASDRPA